MSQADVTMTVTFDRAVRFMCDAVDDLLRQGYTLEQLHCALGVAVGTIGSQERVEFLIGLAAGASWVEDYRRKHREQGEKVSAAEETTVQP